MPIVPIRIKSNAKLVRKSLEDLTAEIPKIGQQQIYNVLLRARSRLKQPGAPVTYPIPWDSIKQKIKVIIMLRAQGNLPYRRSGDYQKAFKIVKQKTGYDMTNDAPQAIFIGGDAEGLGQSRIFQGRYPLVRKVIDEEMLALPPTVLEYISIETQKRGFGSAGSAA